MGTQSTQGRQANSKLYHFLIKQTGFQCHISQHKYENSAQIRTTVYLVLFEL